MEAISTVSPRSHVLDVLKVVVSPDGDMEELTGPVRSPIASPRSTRLPALLSIVLLFAAALFAWEELRVKSDSIIGETRPPLPHVIHNQAVADSNSHVVLPEPSTPQAENPQQNSSPPPLIITQLEDHSIKLGNAQLIDKELFCATAISTSNVCDFTWNSTVPLSDLEDALPLLAAEDKINAQQQLHARPQDFYTFQAGIHMTEAGPGALVRIRMRDLCCTVTPGIHLPLSYFRITAIGASQAASNPPLALGALPAALGRGHQPVVRAKQQWGQHSNLTHVDEERVLQTFLLLPDPGHYEIRVRLLHFNSSIEMISEKYPERSYIYNERPGTWVSGLLKNAQGHRSTKLFIPLEASLQSRAFTDRSKLPLCGADTAEEYERVRRKKGHIQSLPLAGRWVLSPTALHDLQTEQQAQSVVAADHSTTAAVPARVHPESFLWDVDFTNRSPQWLVEHSKYQPYDCYLDQSVSYGDALERVRWLHLTGDSNIRNKFFTICGLANGTATYADPKVTPRKMDPPHLCIGPTSSKHPSPKWVVSYTNWFWLKPQTLDPSFNFRSQCKQFEPGNPRGIFRGWPGCENMPDFIQDMDGPGATYFGWGSHAAEFGYNPDLQSAFETDQTFAMPYFKAHPTLFALTTANSPSMIPDKFGFQQRIRNNERVYGSNLHLMQAVQNQSPEYSSHASSPNDSWYPIFDLFSPSHAAFESLLGDAVHYRGFFYERGVDWLMHYLKHAPNFARPRKSAANDEGKQ